MSTTISRSSPNDLSAQVARALRQMGIRVRKATVSGAQWQRVRFGSCTRVLATPKDVKYAIKEAKRNKSRILEFQV